MSGRRRSSIRSKVINILVTGYQKMKEPQKHHVFILEVTWNNGERYETYRRYSDFFSFHTALKALFPNAAGRGSEQRTIPQMPKRNFVLRSQVTRVTEAKLEQFNYYCRTVISLEPDISESAHVLGFFTPRLGDKQLPMLQFRRPVSSLQASGEAAATNKKEFEEYYALADFAAEDTSQVTFKTGDKVLVKTKDESGWWLCKVNGKMGWAPPTYLKKKEEEVTIRVENTGTEITDLERSEDSQGYITVQPSFRHIVTEEISEEPINSYEDTAAINFGPGESGSPDPEITAEEYVAIVSYQAEGPGQVSFEEGDRIHVFDKLEDGWWYVVVGEQEGWAPCSFLERLNGEDEEEEEIITTLENVEKYHAVDDYEAEEEDEISFPEGAVVDVLQKRLDGWWLVQYENQTGLAPGTFLRKGPPPVKPDLPIISENQESDSFPVSDSRRKEALSYENVQLQMMRAQPPRRKSMRNWVKNKNGYLSPRTPQVQPRQSPQPQKTSYVNHQSYLGADLNLLQEATAAKSNTLGTARELAVSQREARQYPGSIREVLRGRGGVKNKVQAFETDGPGEVKDPPIMMMKPNMPKARIRKRNPSQTREDSPGSGPGLSQTRPRIKPRTKLRETSPIPTTRDESPPPPLPPKTSNKSPSHVVTSPTRTTPNQLLADEPPPLGSGHPLRSHDLSDEPPPLGPGHPLRSAVELPQQPPRPTPSVYQRAKDTNRREIKCLVVPSKSEDLDTASSLHSNGSSPTSINNMSSRSYPRTKPRQKVKKTKSHSSADERYQSPRLPIRAHQPVARMKSANESTEGLYSTHEVPPQNSVGGAAGGGGGGNPFSEEMTGTLIKYILASPDPSLKATLKNLLENNETVRNSLV